jgi:hypothetical protein
VTALEVGRHASPATAILNICHHLLASVLLLPLRTSPSALLPSAAFCTTTTILANCFVSILVIGSTRTIAVIILGLLLLRTKTHLKGQLQLAQHLAFTAGHPDPNLEQLEGIQLQKLFASPQVVSLREVILVSLIGFDVHLTFCV